MNEPRSETNAAEQRTAGTEPEVSRVTAGEVKERVDRGEPIAFVDSRSGKAWDTSDVKIRGAIRIPPDDAPSLLSNVPRDRSVVVYCT